MLLFKFLSDKNHFGRFSAINGDECVDKDGKRVANGETYTPDGSDPCKTCSCMEGEPGPCRYKYCSPPTCKRYEMIPGTCCGFVCLEDEEETLGTSTNNLNC